MDISADCHFVMDVCGDIGKVDRKTGLSSI
jgi:hypothetical protein